MSEITTQSGGTLPANFMDKLLTGIAESRASTLVTGGGKPILRMLKTTGAWVWGQTNEPMQPGSRWVLNITSLQHGWVCWDDGEMKGEVLVSMLDPKPARPQPVNGAEYEERRAFELRCYDGDDEGVEVVYKINSMGGIKGVDTLLQTIQRRIAVPEFRSHPCPVIVFDHSSYDHPKYNIIHNPIFNVVGWSDMNGNLMGSPPKAETKKPTKAPLTAAQEEPAAPVEPKSTTQARVGQRRRPPVR